MPVTSLSAPACVLLVNYMGIRGQLSCIPAKWQFQHTDKRLDTVCLDDRQPLRAQSNDLQQKLQEGERVLVTALLQH